MATPKPPCVTLPAWLKVNLGKRVLAPLTGTDWRALKAAIQIVELWQQCDMHDEGKVAEAFATVVRCMQESCRYLAFHAIAHVAEWDTRLKFWTAARLDLTRGCELQCAYAPGGTYVDAP